MSDDEIKAMKRALLDAAETVNVPTCVMRRLLASYEDAAADQERLRGYRARFDAVLADGALGPAITLDDNLLPDGSF